MVMKRKSISIAIVFIGVFSLAIFAAGKSIKKYEFKSDTKNLFIAMNEIYKLQTPLADAATDFDRKANQAINNDDMYSLYSYADDLNQKATYVYNNTKLEQKFYNKQTQYYASQSFYFLKQYALSIMDASKYIMDSSNNLGFTSPELLNNIKKSLKNTNDTNNLLGENVVNAFGSLGYNGSNMQITRDGFYLKN